MSRRRKSYRSSSAEGRGSVERLMRAIEHRIPGDKVLTLVYGNPSQEFVVDVSGAGMWGYAAGVRELFTAKLLSAMRLGGGLMVRAFLPMFFDLRRSDGKSMQVPYKKLYGFVLGNDQWHGLIADEVKECCCTDAVTGQPLPSEPGVLYADTAGWERGEG